MEVSVPGMIRTTFSFAQFLANFETELILRGVSREREWYSLQTSKLAVVFRPGLGPLRSFSYYDIKVNLINLSRPLSHELEGVRGG